MSCDIHGGGVEIELGWNEREARAGCGCACYRESRGDRQIILFRPCNVHAASQEPGALMRRLMAGEPTLPPEIEDMTMIYPTDDADDRIPWEMHIRFARNGDWYVATSPKGAQPLRWVRVTTSGSRCPGVAPAIADAFRAMGRTFFASKVGQQYLAEIRKGRL